MYSREESAARRNLKIRSAMHNLGPIWLINEEFRPVEESSLFDLVYLHSVYGWVQHRFKYDAFNDVLYHMGERRLNENEALHVQEQEPYIGGEVAAAVPNHPLGRPSPPLPAPTKR